MAIAHERNLNVEVFADRLAGIRTESSFLCGEFAPGNRPLWTTTRRRLHEPRCASATRTFGSKASNFRLYFSRYAESRQANGYAGYGEWTHRVVDGEINRAKFLGIF
jgi:hypothetical protein